MFSLCIPTYNRIEETLNSFSLVLKNPHISEVVIRDDGSNISTFMALKQKIDKLEDAKIKLYSSKNNSGAFINKYETVKCASRDWIILLDSDNQIDNLYIETLLMQHLEKNTVYMPSIAKCGTTSLDYTGYSGQTFDKVGYIQNVDKLNFDVLLNTGNYCFHKFLYLNAYDMELLKENPFAVDVYYINYLMMKNNVEQKFYVVPNLNYEHRLSSDSYWVRTAKNSNSFLFNLKQNIRTWK